HPRMHASYEASIDTGQVRQLTQNSSLPSGVVRFVGSMQYQTEANRALVDTLSLDGNLTSSSLQLHAATSNTEVRDLSAHYILAKGNVDVQEIRAQAFGGNVSGAMTIRDIMGSMQSEAHATLNKVDLAKIRNVMGSSSLQPVALSGTADASIEARWN